MYEDNEEKFEKRRRKKKKKKKSGLKIFFIILLMIIVISLGTVSGIVIKIAKDAPEIDPTNIGNLLNQTSFIVDQNGQVIEKIQTQEYRTIVKLDKIPEHLQNAFISIEDERFKKHIGVDPKGIISSLIDNIKAGEIVRGASTITQQLARNLYLSSEQKLDRKIKEAYLALKIEKTLTKQQILEAYLNRIYLGQGAYGVQEAAQTYFSKNVDELTIAESALLAGIVKSPTNYSPYRTFKPEDFDSKTQHEITQLDILGEKYIAVYNEKSIKRQRTVLDKMKQLGYITQQEYTEALNEDIKSNLKPGQKKVKGISTYFNDYVKSQVIDALMTNLNYTKEQAEKKLYTGGLRIYSTMDLNLQHKLEDIYANFTKVLFGNTSKTKGPVLVSWSLDRNRNIIDNNRHIVYFNQNNLLNENKNLIIEKGTYNLTDNNLIIKNKKFSIYKGNIDISDCYTINEKKNLVTHSVGSLSIGKDNFSIGTEKEVIICKDFLNNNKDFYTIDSNGNLLINSKFFYYNNEGIVQPQSASVIIDQKTGQIKALVGGRDIKGNKLLNRATASQRQPGSSIKPVGVYLPALDNGYTAASIIDDIPHYDHNGNLWPRNWYSSGYRGITTLRKSVEQSMNVNSVKLLEEIGLKTSMKYLTKLGIIDENNPQNDSFVTRGENNKHNDENSSALALGGMTRGLTPLELTAAYSAIANNGTYTEPIAFTKILDKNGNMLLENKPKKNIVVSPQVAYIMTDILRTTVSNGIAHRAQISNMPVAGKTGTTQNKADVWFVGYTPYYTAGVWIGNDSPTIKLSSGSSMAANLWKNIMTEVHKELEKKSFEKPNNIVSVNICTQSGKLPSKLCAHDPRGSTIRSEIFVKGTEPKQHCDVHVKEKIDTTTNKIANEYCPKQSVIEKVFIKRNPPYDPKKNNGIIPQDYKYTVPNEQCDVHSQNSNINDWLDNWFDNEDNEDNEHDNNNSDNEDKEEYKKHDKHKHDKHKKDNKKEKEDKHKLTPEKPSTNEDED